MKIETFSKLFWTGWFTCVFFTILIIIVFIWAIFNVADDRYEITQFRNGSSTKFVAKGHLNSRHGFVSFWTEDGQYITISGDIVIKSIP